MSGSFDPYHKWLGIASKDQPPNHYRLLGVDLFEGDRGVIDAAANRVLSYLKELAVGDDGAQSQRIMNEVSQARICLLNPRRRAEYDVQLRAKLAGTRPRPRASKRPASAPPDAPRASASLTPLIKASPRSIAHSPPYARIRRRSLNAVLIGSLLAAFGCLLLLVFFLLGKVGSDDQNKSASDPGTASGAAAANSADAQRSSKGDEDWKGMPGEPRQDSVTESGQASLAGEAKRSPGATGNAGSNAASAPAELGAKEQTPSRPVMTKREIPAQTSPGSSVGADGSATATVPAPEPMPSIADVATAKRVIEEMFSAEIDLATTAPQQIATARHLLLAASDDRLEAPKRLVLLTEALRLALAAGDAKVTNDVLDRFARDFTIPGLTDDVSGWDAKAAILQTLSVRARTSAEQATMAGAALVFAKSAARNGRLDLARSTAAMAVGEAREAGDVELFRKATLRYLEVRDGRL